MRKERDILKVSQLETNNGQLGWLPKNPRQWTQTDIDRTKASIQEDTDFLEDRPLLVCPGLAGKYVVFGGNLRLTAARSLKLKEVPVVVYCLDEGGPEQDEIRLTVKRRAMKDNGSFGAWDYDALANEWDDLPLNDWGVPAWDTEKETPPATATEDDFNEDTDNVETRCKRGDVWVLGDHRLMCGDATNREDVDKLMNGSRADLLLTDPPYNVDYASKNETLNAAGKGSHIQTDIVNDKMTDAEFSELLEQSFRNATENLKPGGAFYVWTAQGHRQIDVALALDKNGLFFRQQIIWVKNNLVLGRMDYQGKHEPCLYGWKEGAGHTFADTRTETTVINEDKPHLSDLHPTTKPVPLFARLVGNSTKEGEIVLDLFGGSGTTLIAAEQLNRRCFMMELDPHYCDVIISRWETFTGKTARLITPGDKVS